MVYMTRWNLNNSTSNPYGRSDTNSWHTVTISNVHMEIHEYFNEQPTFDEVVLQRLKFENYFSWNLQNYFTFVINEFNV